MKLLDGIKGYLGNFDAFFWAKNLLMFPPHIEKVQAQKCHDHIIATVKPTLLNDLADLVAAALKLLEYLGLALDHLDVSFLINL